jgi:RsiW-degrading membrane proteinase PrsW (M82 family)
VNPGELSFLFLVLIASFIPSLAALLWLWSMSRGRKERWEDLFLTFAFGSVVAAIAALIIELIASTVLLDPLVREYELLALDPSVPSYVMVIIIAPLVEEYVKALGVKRHARHMWRPRNGLIFGAAVGLGFAATENFLYEGTAYLEQGLEALAALAVMRSFSSTLMHASASSIAGYGIARSKTYGGPWWHYLAAAVLMHAAFNLFASFRELFSDTYGEVAGSIGLMFSIMLVLVVLLFIRSRLRGYHA